MLDSTPFLLFDGTCADAMTFYQRCFGGELTVTRLGDSPMKDQLPVEKHGRVINAHLERGNFRISATDWMASPASEPVTGNTTAVLVRGDQHDEFTRAFDLLSAGAATDGFQPLHQLPIGTYGQLCDRFGVHWIFLLPGS